MKPEKQKASLSQLRAEVLAGQKHLQNLRGAESRAAKDLRTAKQRLKDVRRSQKRTKTAAKKAKTAARQAARHLEKLQGRVAKIQAKPGRTGKKAKAKAPHKPGKAR